MRYALFSDVHANLPALEAVLHEVSQDESLAAIYHLGDLVGYAPWPNETVALIASSGVAGVGGNYDTTVALNYKHCGCRYEDPHQEALAHQSFESTKRNTSSETNHGLGELPFRLDVHPYGGHASGPTLALVHGTPVLNTAYWTEDRPDAFCLKMAELAGLKPGDVIAFGHTHKPWHRTVEGIHFVNTGSVGRPKDGDWRAGFAVVDFAGPASEQGALGAVSVSFRRVEYDLERAAAGIQASDLPHEFAEYLRTGGQPAPVGADTA